MSYKSSDKIYGNCQVLSPLGVLMFRCDEKKANWYLKRNLGELVGVSPLIVKLSFNPNGLGNHSKSFGLEEMRNICVNCGSGEELTRHHVVPFCYRKYFPYDIKSHNFHDVLVMCVDCHDRYERKADELKKQISIEYDSPVSGVVVVNNRHLVKYIKISCTLLNGDLPKFRSNILRSEIKKYFNIKRLTKKRLIEISNLDTYIIKRTHGEEVISKLDDINDFIKKWRVHFIENNKCLYMPKNWDVNYEM